MRKYLGFVAVSVFLLSCADTERNNPYDERAFNYTGNASVEGLSSSVETDDYPSSSSEESLPSSSSVMSSSSSRPPSSSSTAPSSSSVVPSSSSRPPSSSSEAESSSSVAPSSSSYGGLCASFVDGTEREHYGKMKKQFCDERDGKEYVYVQIDTQTDTLTWMAENLNYAASGSKCGNGSILSDKNTTTCDTYGRLYNWATVMNLVPSCNSSTCSSQIQSPHKSICPSGWHIPSHAEWNVLSLDAKKLKATSGWNNGNGTDDYGFSALPGGYGYSNGSFSSVGNGGGWWTATETGARGAYAGIINDDVRREVSTEKSNLFSVRCVQD